MYCLSCGKVFTKGIDTDSQILHLGDIFFTKITKEGIIEVGPSVIGTISKLVTCCKSPDLYWDSPKEPTMNIFCLTFASDHPLGNHWIEVEAADEGVARKRIFEVFGEKWGFLYAKEHFKSEYFPAGKVGKTLRAD
uniref:Uncharacterized protein n=1 Tax=viral metagenome TaxID=1070528 RepID=A0A6M3KZZ5_9ZZZZ